MKKTPREYEAEIAGLRDVLESIYDAGLAAFQLDDAEEVDPAVESICDLAAEALELEDDA